MTDRTDLIGTPSAMAASNQVVAMFETYDQARAARDALVAAGIDRSQIELLDRSAADDDASFRYERNEEGFWTGIKHLFMPDEDNHFYAEGINRGHAMLVVRGMAGEQDQIITLLDDQHPLDVETHAAQWRQAGWTGQYAAGATAPTTRDSSTLATGDMATRGREEVIPVYEEQLRIGKREVGRGSVRVRSYVVETPVQEQVRLHEEHIDVERRPVDRSVTTGDVGAGAFQERTIEVTATAEEAVIAKETRVKEEILVRKEEEDRTQTVSGTVRRTEVEVEDDRASSPRAVPTPPPVRRP